MPAYTLDTNVVIYYVGDEEKTVSLIRPLLVRNAVLYVPTVVITEVFSAELSGEERATIEMIFGTVQVVPLYEHTARVAADLRRKYRLKLPDATIAATALTTSSTLLT